MTERIGDTYQKKKADFKIKYDPLSIYLKQEYPNPGLEVLYVKGENNGDAWINPNGFPWITMSMDPLGSTMRKGQHHSIFKSGFEFFLTVLQHLYDKYQSEAATMIEFDGTVKYGDVLCYKITVNNPNFNYVDYTVRPGENLETLSRKLFVCDYMIYDLNPQLSSYEDIKPGTKLKVPNDYGKQFVLYIDTQKLVPAGVKIYDDKGLFEEYSYLNTIINPSFSNMEFTESYAGYGF